MRWENGLSWFRKFAPKKGVVGIELSDKGLAIAARNENGDLQALAVNDLELQLEQSNEDFLKAFVSSQGLEGETCHLVIPYSKYQLLLVEAPDVPMEEMREAMQWRIKDLLSTPVEKTGIDVFSLPDNGARGRHMLYVVASDKDYLNKCIEFINESGLKLNSIDINELALRNISLLQEGGKVAGRGIALVRITSKESNVSLYQEGNLYLSRSFNVNYKGGLLEDLPVDSLMLEIQRSLDYYERQMGQRPPSSIYLFGENISEDKLTDDLCRGLSGAVKILDLSDHVKNREDLPLDLLAPCVSAIGASLRGVVYA